MSANGEKLLTRAELAQIVGVYPQTITKWAADGMPVAEPGRRGRGHHYLESEVRAWMQVREEKQESGNTIDLTAARAEKEHWQAKINEQKFKVLERELLPAEEVEKNLVGVFAAIRNRMLSWPGTISPEIDRASKMGGAPGVQRFLEDAVREVLMELPDVLDAPKVEPVKPKKKTKRKAKRKTRKKKTA